MTYINYINYFWRMDEALGFSPVETKLFLKLLDIANRLNWKEDCLMIPMKKLMVAMDCSKNTILKARKRLTDCGMIAVKAGDKNKRSACYRILCDYLNHGKKEGEHGLMASQEGEGNCRLEDENRSEPVPRQLTPIVEKKEASEQSFEGETVQVTEQCHRLEKDKEKDQRQMMMNDPGRGLTVEKIVQLFHRLCPTLKKVKKLSKFTLEKLTERANHFKTPEDWERYFSKASESKFLCGHNNYGWQADFNWLIKDAQTPQKVLSGCYDTKKKTQKGPRIDTSQEYDIVRGTYQKQAYFTNDNHLVAALAG